MSALGPEVFALRCDLEVERIGAFLRHSLGRILRRRGLVVAVSGGVDSAVCLALAARAVGPSKVLALLLPERESSAEGLERGREVALTVGVEFEVHDITPALEGLGAYHARDEAIRRLVPAYDEGWRCRVATESALDGRLAASVLVVRSPEGDETRRRLPHRVFLEVLAAQAFKQRTRKLLEYYHADRRHYAVAGTPNRLEYDQGFFVKLGDGAADVKPIAHLYKTQVYALARHLGLPESVCRARPTTDTWSLAQGQDEHYFGLPVERMDLALWAHDHEVPPASAAGPLGLRPDETAGVYRSIEAKRVTARSLHAKELLVPRDGREAASS